MQNYHSYEITLGEVLKCIRAKYNIPAVGRFDRISIVTPADGKRVILKQWDTLEFETYIKDMKERKAS